ncbi:MAG: RNA polymerase II mediator complex subunit [Alectoria sarmentosa]|nr:MAG: RNA polymerase II mediator complex subunit [Alectoria sarmentosa]
MPDQLSLSLQAFPTVDKDKESLKYLISRINQQKGSFRNVTEQSLEEEIQAQDAGKPDNDQDVVEKVEEVEDVKTKQEDVTKARDDIIKQIGQAYNESAQALDFVSLLLSKHAPAAAQTTLSPFLQQTLPLGSLGGEVVQEPQVSELEKHNRDMVSIGWRMQSLNGAADSLLKSAARLEEEMERETTYWDQVLAVKEQGWSLSRLPREKHTLGVRYGFAEAYADFRDRGLAALRRDADGNISLDRGLRSSGDRALRVRILRQGKPIASSSKSTEGTPGDNSVTKEILKARNSIFDEELHHELHREARNLVNQGVRCIGGSVLLPYETNNQIEIDLVSLEDEDLEVPTGDGTIADAIALSLRILLSHAHRQNLQRRSQIPPPLREAKPPRPIYALLKPVIEHIQHQSQVASLTRFLSTLHQTLSAARLPFSFNPPSSPHSLSTLSTTSAHPKKSMVETLLQTLTSPLHSTTTLHLPTAPTTAVIDIHTTLLPPHYSTTFTLTIHASSPSTTLVALPTPTNLTTLSALTNHILHVLMLSILQHTATTFPTWQAPSTLHGSTLSRTNEKSQLAEKASISLTGESLSLRWWRGAGGEWRACSWYADEGQGNDGGGGEKRGFVEVFREEVDGR